MVDEAFISSGVRVVTVRVVTVRVDNNMKVGASFQGLGP